MGNKTISLGVIALLLLVGGLTWWVMSTSPNQALIEAAQNQPLKLPSVNLQLLSNEDFTGRTLNGNLPIKVEGVGREDPFAGA